MTDGDGGPVPRDSLRRYGPLALIVVVLIAVGAVVVLDGDDEPAASGDAVEDVVAGQGAGDEGAPEPTGRMPLTYAEAESAGTVDDLDWGERCDPETGRVRIPTVYAAPCVPVFDGDNGGATSPGVTGETVTVVRYLAGESGDLNALIADSAEDTPEALARTFQDFVDIYASRAELYGRRIEVVDYQGTGAGDDVVAARADATQIATELQPFAVIGGPGIDRGTFAQELTSRGIVCFDCAGSLPDPMLDEMAPYVWASGPSGEQYIDLTLAAWQSKLDDGGPAAFAGPDLRDQPRKVGIIHFDQDPPVYEVSRSNMPEGIELVESYVLDFGTLPQKATELVAKFKAEDITTVQFLGDPIMPMFLMTAATEQSWFPEWIFTGTVLTDTNFFARQYDPRQMEHAFGISQLAAPTARDIQDPIRLYRWYFGGEDTLPPAKGYALLPFSVRFMVQGLHMAGPDLTPETFARGQFRIPPAGGGPTTPQISFGNWGFFPDPDYRGIDDSTEIWWDASVAAPDETGVDGTGVWRRAHGGLRFINQDDVPTPDPFAHADDTITVLDELPAEDAPPDHPPPPGSPAERDEP
jgi:hypothetical protein